VPAIPEETQCQYNDEAKSTTVAITHDNIRSMIQNALQGAAAGFPEYLSLTGYNA
jgi:ribosomal protein L6P/L9E